MEGYFPEADFYLQRRNVDHKWKSALIAAFILHAALFGWSFYFPGFISKKPLLEETITVDLVSLPEPSGAPEPAPSQPVAAPQPPAAEPEPQPVEPEEPEVAIPDEMVPPPEPVAEAKPISVKPKKTKIKMAKDTRLAEEIDRQKQTEALRERLRQEEQRKLAERERKRKAAEQERKQRAAALARAEQAKREAEQAAREARKALADMYRSQGSLNKPASTPSATRTSRGRGQSQSVVEQQYYTTFKQHIESFWVLLEMRKWSANTKAVVIVTVNRNGQLLKTAFEQKSGDPFFDQLVENTVRKAAPMPKFPGLMKENTLEFGLVFTPGKLVQSL